MIHHLALQNPLVSTIVAELRDVNIQKDRLRFRTNLERLGAFFAFKISETLPTKTIKVTTPLGIANCTVIAEQPVLATILRAGLPLHSGLLQYFDQADNAFISAYRHHHKSGKFTIKLEYASYPDLDGRTLIIADPMLATGASMRLTIQQLLNEAKPKHIHVVTAVACTEGIDQLRRNFKDITIWAATIDDELTAKGYIVPGLGDAGDLSYGTKKQQ